MLWLVEAAYEVKIRKEDWAASGQQHGTHQVDALSWHVSVHYGNCNIFKIFIRASTVPHPIGLKVSLFASLLMRVEITAQSALKCRQHIGEAVCSLLQKLLKAADNAL